MNEEDEVKSIADDIMEYLRRRPGASDSFEGVAHWWLLQQTIEKNMGLVEKALEQLACEGKIAKSQDDQNETIYRLHRNDRNKRE